MSEEERTPPAPPLAPEDAPEDAPEATAEDGAEATANADAQATKETTAAPGAAPGAVAALERRVAELERELDQERDSTTDYMNRWQRAQADFSNYRRRQQQDQEQLRRVLSAEAAKLVLPALDSFERAFATLPESLRGLTWIDGIALVSMQLEGSLRALGIQPIPAEPGQAFDPRQHEAIGEVETSEHPSGHITAVAQRGYEVEGMVLRAALVQVARAPQAGTSQGASAAGEAPPSGSPPGSPPGSPAGAEGASGEATGEVASEPAP